MALGRWDGVPVKPGTCTVCSDPQRAAIDAAAVAGTSLVSLAEQFGRSKNTLQKHVSRHIPAAAQKAAAVARDVDAGESILDEIASLKREATRLQGAAEKKRDVRAALMAIDRLTRLIELQARLLGELRDRDITITNVQLDPDTLLRMAELHVARHRRPAAAAGLQPVVTVQPIENTEQK